MTEAVASVGWAVSDVLVLTRRHLLQVLREPQALFWTMVQPITNVLLFVYVIGGIVALPDGGSYRDYLMAGVFTQTVVFSAASTAIGLAEDLQRGIIDRFRVLPLARAAVLLGRTVSDLVRNTALLGVMMGVALVVGWRAPNGVGGVLAGALLIEVFAYAVGWLGVMIGLSVPNAQTATAAGLTWVFPLMFVSSSYVPLPSLPDWLRPVAEWNPLTAVVSGARELFGTSAGVGAWKSASLPLAHPTVTAVVWAIVIIAVSVPVAGRKFARLSRS
ncbi:ABC transporter permease [Sphaerisporangium corydalis]|uniref:Transport permease protein n=1 Tax=Sphaerisporangium corydalis TaxID=1441875 RepID=A0ABV9EFR4_9ACTN|nr:ABC transporter permease [Sphaerisporangium corydalis]